MGHLRRVLQHSPLARPRSGGVLLEMVGRYVFKPRSFGPPPHYGLDYFERCPGLLDELTQCIAGPDPLGAVSDDAPRSELYHAAYGLIRDVFDSHFARYVTTTLKRDLDGQKAARSLTPTARRCAAFTRGGRRSLDRRPSSSEDRPIGERRPPTVDDLLSVRRSYRRAVAQLQDPDYLARRKADVQRELALAAG